MKTIFKYRLKVDLVNPQQITVPKGSKILKVHNQDDTINLWIEATDSIEKEELRFAVFNTGDPLASNPMKYLDTVFLFECNEVYHVYQLT